MSKQQTVFVGMSGGVDSSVAALRLKSQGYNVVGVFIKVWHPDWLMCNWEQERLDAMRVAAHLDVPFLTCDAEAAYRDEVAQYFIAEYKAGRTPNPDVMCNQHVKFGAFLDFATEHGADFIATGHYAQLLPSNTKVRGLASNLNTSTTTLSSRQGLELHRGVDTDKDQSYFLWSLTDQQLAKSLFPVGDTPKTASRQEAAQAKIPVAAKKDSQGVCFLGHIDIPEFLSHYVELQPGEVVDTAGTVIGTHQGALVYTIGQRHGFTLSVHDENHPQLYVVAKDTTNNTITVAPEPPHLPPQSQLTIEHIVLRAPLAPGDAVEVQCRYRQQPRTVTVASCTETTVTFDVASQMDRPASGQSCVLYRGTHCLGGGIIV